MFDPDCLAHGLNRRRHLQTVLLVTVFCATAAPAACAQIDLQKLPPAAQRPVDYKADIQPLFAKHCVRCHGPQKQKGDLRLDTRTGTLKGGLRGPSVIPEKVQTSPLLIAISQLDAELAMPPDDEPLSDDEVGLVRAWIEQGARGPDDSAAAGPKIPWSFHPIVRPAVPANQVAGTLPVDAFIAAKRQPLQVPPSPAADRRTLIRRLFLIMHGLPPTPEQVDEFVNDTAPDAYERLVDRVLASPRYGERWARHWLDVVRFAESNGFETNRVRQGAWPYRDYVIEAFNTDKPYDAFVREQIAGDALGADAATGFLVAGAYDLVKSPDITLTLMQRQDELADIINTTGTAFLGLTLGCARCHEHKFDPVPQQDYYALQAIFAGVNFAPRPFRPRRTASEDQLLASARRDLEQDSAALETLREKSRRTSGGGRALLPKVNEKLNTETFAPIATTAVRMTILATSNGSEPCLDEVEIFDRDGQNVALASAGTRPSASGTLPGYEIHKLAHLNDGRTGNDHSWISSQAGRGWVQLDFPEPRTISRIVWSRDRASRFRDRVATTYRFEARIDSERWQTIAASEDREPFGPDDPEAFLKNLSADDAARARELQTRLASQQARVNELSSGLNAWLGTFSQPEPIHRLHRGDPLQKREVIPPNGLSLRLGPGFPGQLGLSGESPEQERRRKLADWLASPDNPLTPRVMVNRIWHYVFGTGLVETPSDFGGNGALPSHPELLDWLARELIDHGWSLKHIQRQLLLSQTFRQSSAPQAEGLSADATSRYLWRFPPRRLEAEAIRDCILAASGALDLRMGGPGFFLQIVEVDNVYRYFPKEQFGPDEFRRMVYLNRIRQEQDSVFGSFDCPSGNQVTPRRSRSNTPLQALNLFNSPFVLQQAERLATRLEHDAGTTPAAQIRRAFLLLNSREPDTFEIQAATELIQQYGLAAFCRALFNSSEFLFVF
ncbi:MAG: DUF1553 domain-containing protein [Planctomycetes bacterium]|nr:DUF1553 domain-containing protein [Planctomycetota bacterium]